MWTGRANISYCVKGLCEDQVYMEQVIMTIIKPFYMTNIIT